MNLIDEEDAAIALYESSEGKSLVERTPVLSAALSAFEKILKRDSNNVTAHFHLALIHLDQGNYQTALSHAEQVRNLKPREPNICLNIGVIYRNMGDTETGLKFYKRELARDAENPDVIFNLGLIYFERHRWKTAAKYFEKSFQLKHRIEDFIVKLAVCYRKTGDVEKEIEVYQRYLKVCPNDGWALQNLGAALIDISDYKKSLYYLNKAKKVFPDEPLIEENRRIAVKGVESSGSLK